MVTVVMNKNIWQKQDGPLMVLAPMADVTDAAFRRIISKYGAPDIFYTEFVSADGLMHPEAQEKLKRELYFTKAERPIVAQIFSGKPESIKESARLVAELGFDGVDINCGCPDRTVEKQGAGACLIKTPEKIAELVLSAKEGVASADSHIPVSIKTRVGYNKVDIENLTKVILEAEPAALIYHLRTRKEMSKVPANWDLIKIPVAMAKGSQTQILGNGDVVDLNDAKDKARKYGVDGVMLGRAIFGNPWLFANLAQLPTKEEKLKVLIEHTNLFQELFRPGPTNQKLFNDHTKSFHVMKRHFKAYVNGFDGAAELRAKLMEAENAEEVAKIIGNFDLK